LNYNNILTKRTTVSLDTEIYTRLRKHGKFGESFSRLIGRILDEIEGGGEVNS
jgi:predicted CopG family antitoxin